MNSEHRDAWANALMLELSNLSEEIGSIPAGLKKHATGFDQVGRKLSEHAEQIILPKNSFD